MRNILGKSRAGSHDSDKFGPTARAAVIFIGLWAVFADQAGATLRTLREKPQVIRLLALGALVGPVLGVSSSLLAVQHAEIGVASTLMAWTKSHTLFSRNFA